MKSEYIALAGRIKRALLDLEGVVKRAEWLQSKAQTSGDDGFFDGVALNLHGFYSGVERIFEDIARTMERSIPKGVEWHQDLLLQMSAEISSIRPPVVKMDTRDCLEEYRGFRHVVRNVYTFHLRPARLQELTTRLRPCYESVERDLSDFIIFLEKMIED